MLLIHHHLLPCNAISSLPLGRVARAPLVRRVLWSAHRGCRIASADFFVALWFGASVRFLKAGCRVVSRFASLDSCRAAAALSPEAQSGKDRHLTGPPHTTHHAGPQWAVQRVDALD